MTDAFKLFLLFVLVVGFTLCCTGCVAMNGHQFNQASEFCGGPDQVESVTWDNEVVHCEGTFTGLWDLSEGVYRRYSVEGVLTPVLEKL